MKAKKAMATFILAAFLLAAGCSPIQGADEARQELAILRLATDLEEESAGYRQLQNFQKRLDEQSGGRIQIKLYPSELWSENESLIDYLGVEALEMVCVSNTLAREKVPAYEIYDLPYLFRDRQAIARYLTGSQGREALALVEPLGYQAVGFVGNGYQFFLQSRGSSVVTGWRGLTMACQMRPLWRQGLTAIGVTPVEIVGNEPFLDARMADEAQAKKWMAQQIVNEGTYLNDPDMFYQVEMVLCDKKWWDDLPKDDRELIRECFDESLSQSMQSLQTASLGSLFARGGITLDYVTNEQKEALYQATAGVRSQYLYSGSNPLAAQWIPAAPLDEGAENVGQ